jgi:hypothetical protein
MELGRLPGGTVVMAADKAHGAKLLATADDFVENQSAFDRQARLSLRTEVVEVSPAMYFDYVASQVMDWSADEIAALKGIVQAVAGKLEPLDFSLPEVVHLVKTSGEEEGHAAYTRQMNVIVLPVNMIQSLFTQANFGDPLHSGTSPSYLTDVVTHELFHLFSKNNADRRWALYALVHYEPTGDDVELPNVPWPKADSTVSLPELKITNPDTPNLNTFIRMEVPTVSGPGPTTIKPLLPVLLATGPYAGGVFFEYLDWWFMAIVDADGRWVAELDHDQRPIMYQSKPLMNQYMKLVGNNIADELFHPDEILAQNWVLVANEPDLTLLSSMAGILR